MMLSATGNGCEGPQPSKSPPIIVDSSGRAIAGRCAGGRPLRRRRWNDVICDGQRLRGTAALQGLHRSSLTAAGEPLPAGLLEGARSVGAAVSVEILRVMPGKWV